jgi:hypothetical protein
MRERAAGVAPLRGDNKLNSEAGLSRYLNLLHWDRANLGIAAKQGTAAEDDQTEDDRPVERLDTHLSGTCYDA